MKKKKIFKFKFTLTFTYVKNVIIWQYKNNGNALDIAEIDSEIGKFTEHDMRVFYDDEYMIYF